MLARLVVEKGLATKAQVAACEAEQHRIAKQGDYKPLAEILTERGILSAGDAQRVVREANYREHRTEDEELAQLAAGEGILPLVKLEECLELQQDEFFRTGTMRRLGQILVEKGYATPETAVRILEARERQEVKRKASGTGPKRPSTAIIPVDRGTVTQGDHDDQLFARLALQRNFVQREQLATCLQEQAIAKRYGQYLFIGDLLRDRGFLSPESYEALRRLEEATSILQQDLLFAKVGLQIGTLLREHVDAALTEQRRAARAGTHPPPRIGELLMRAKRLKAEDSIRILEATEKLAEKLKAKQARWSGREAKSPDLQLPDAARKADRILATLLHRQKLLTRDALLDAFREQEIVERHGQAIALEKILRGQKILEDGVLAAVLETRARGLVVCTSESCDGFVERRAVVPGQTVKCRKCGLLLENAEPMEAPRTATPTPTPWPTAPTPWPAGRGRPPVPTPSPAPAPTPVPAPRPAPTSLADRAATPEPLGPGQTIDMPMPDALAAEAPRADVLGEYRIVREIGRGAMGVVYEAIQESLNRKVALKVLLDDFTLDRASVDRFKREAEAAARLHHEHIVPIFDVGEIDDVNYYAMEYVEGRTLDTLLTEEPVAIERAVKIAIQVARALDYAHQKGIIHRDIKPANIMVDRADKVHLMDFGLAKQKGEGTITATDALLGTPMYMSPEQATQRGRVTAQSDVYSLGVTLYETLTLEPPYRGDNFAALVVQIRDLTPKRPSRLNQAVPPALDRIVMKTLAKRPEHRYVSAGSFADDLERFLRNEQVEAKAPGWLPAWAWAVVAAVVLGGAGLAWWAVRPGGGPRPTGDGGVPRDGARRRDSERATRLAALLAEARDLAAAARPDWTRAVAAADEAVALDPEGVAALTARAAVLLGRGGEGDATRALYDTRRAANTAPTEPVLSRLRAQAALATGNDGEARDAARLALDHAKQVPAEARPRHTHDALVALGEGLERTGDRPGARAAFLEARALTRDQALGESPRVLLGLARVLVQDGAHTEALGTLDEIERLWPDHPGAWLWRGKACEGQKDLERAIEAYEREAVAARPDVHDAPAAARAAELRAALDALDPYAEATKADQRSDLDYNERGMRAFNDAMRDRRPGVLTPPMQALLRAAASDFAKAVEAGGGMRRGSYLANRALAVAFLADRKHAERASLRALADFGGHPDVREGIRQAFLLGLRDGAALEALCDRLLAKDPTFAPVVLLRGEARLAQGQTEKAVVDLEAARALQPRLDGVEAMLGLARVAQAAAAADPDARRRRQVEARTHLREALARENTYRGEEVKTALAELERVLGDAGGG